MATLLTLDLGTTLFDEAGRLLAVRRVMPPVLLSKPGWSELHPRRLQPTLVDAARELREEIGGFGDVVAVSFATQANSFVLLGERDEALTPIVLWPDQRAAELREQLEALSRVPGFRDVTGMPRFSRLLALAKML